MKRVVRVILVGLWVLLLTIALVTLLMRSNIDERLPDAFVLWLYHEFDLLGIEGYHEIMAGIFFCISFVVASLLTWTGWRAWRRIKAR